MTDEMTIRELLGFDEIATIFPLYRQVSQTTEATFRERIAAMLAQGNYRCVAAFLDGRMVALQASGPARSSGAAGMSKRTTWWSTTRCAAAASARS